MRTKADRLARRIAPFRNHGSSNVGWSWLAGWTRRKVESDGADERERREGNVEELSSLVDRMVKRGKWVAL